MECNEIRDLLPDFHLGNLPPDETERVERHLAEHPECREALEEVASVLDLLHLDAPPVAPPPELKAKVLSRISAERKSAAGTLTPTPPGAPRSPEHRPARQSARRSSAPGAPTKRARNLLAAGLGVALLALGGATLLYADLASENERLRQEVAALSQGGDGGGSSPEAGMLALPLSDTEEAPEARGMLVLDPAEGSVALGVYSLPQPPPGSEYRVWLIPENGDPVALGEMQTNGSGDGQMTGELPAAQATSYERLEITSEPAGSSGKSDAVYLHADLPETV